MRMFRLPVIVVVALAAFGVAASGAAAKPTAHGRPPTVSPAKPVATDTLHVRFRAPAGAANSERYAVAVRTRAHRNCQSFTLVGVDGVVEARDTATVHLIAGTTASFTAWCTGPAVATLLHRVAGGGREGLDPIEDPTEDGANRLEHQQLGLGRQEEQRQRGAVPRGRLARPEGFRRAARRGAARGADERPGFSGGERGD